MGQGQGGGTIWRGVAGVVLVVVGFFVGAFVIEFLTALANAISHGWPASWSRYFGAVAGGFIGTFAGKLLAQAVLKTYPRRGVSLGFVFLNLWLILGDLIYPGPTTGIQIVRAAVAIAAALITIWPGDMNPGTPRAQPQR
jgi:hypothetical protein